MGAADTAQSEGLEQRLTHAAEARTVLPEPALKAMWSRVREETTAASPGLLTRLREQPTAVRVVLAMGVAMVVSAALVLALEPRDDLADVTIERYAVAMSGLILLAAAGFAVSLRGAHQKPLRGWAWAVIALSLGIPVALAAMPSLWVPEGVVVPATDTGYGCTALGILTGGLVSVPAFLLQRGAVPVVLRACAAVAAGGVVAFGLLDVHCPSRDVTHLVVGHAGVGAVLVAVAAAAVVWRRRG